MGLRPHRRNLVIFSSSRGPHRRSSGRPASGHGASAFPRPVRPSRTRRWIRLTGMLVVVGLIRFSRAVRPCWRPLLAGTVLTVAGFIMRGGSGGVLLLPGLLCLVMALLSPGSPEDMQRCELERELASYSTSAQRCDLEAVLDRYPDTMTYELRQILARQPVASADQRLAGR